MTTKGIDKVVGAQNAGSVREAIRRGVEQGIARVEKQRAAYKFVGKLRDLREQMKAALAEYDASDDHVHGTRVLGVNAPCPGGDCNVARARKALEALEGV